MDAAEKTPRKPLTYNDLAELISKLTPEQRAMDALFCDEEKYGQIYGLYEFRDDQINTGEGLEDLTPHREYLISEGYTSEEADREIDADGGILWRKGQPVLDAEEQE